MPAVGDPILADDLLVARLTSNVSLATSSTSLQNVTGLSVAMAANVVYVAEIIVYYDVATGSTEDIKIGASFPGATTSVRLGATGASTGATGADPASDVNVRVADVTTSTTTFAFGATSTAQMARLTGIVSTTGSGTFQLLAAQNTSGSNVVRVLSQSRIQFTRVG